MLALKGLEKFDNLFESPWYSLIATFLLCFNLIWGLHVHCLQIKPDTRHPLCVRHLKIYSNLKRVPIIETNTEVKYAK